MSWREQGSPEWLEMRRSHIMASDAPIIMEVSPFCSPKKLWERKLTGEEAFETNAMRLGTEMEPIAREMYCKQKEIDMEPDVIFHPIHPWMGASLDGISFCGSFAVEIKYCNPKTNKIDHNLARSGKIPEKYFPQLQHQMAVLCIDEIDYCSFNGEEIAIVTVSRDEKYIEELIAREKEFLDCLKECREPIPYNFVEIDNEEWDSLTNKWETLANSKKELISKLKALEEAENVIKNEMIEFADGRNLKSTRWTFEKKEVKGRIEYKNIPELKEIDLEQYRANPTIRYIIKEA